MRHKNSFLKIWVFFMAAPLVSIDDPIGHAQDRLPVAPPAQNLDSKDIDLFSGTLALSDPGVSIGSTDAGELNFSRYWSGDIFRSSGGWNDNQNLNILIPWDGSFYRVTIGNKSYLFETSYSGGNRVPPYTSVLQDGSELTGSIGSFTFKDPSGNIVTFGPKSSYTLNSDQYSASTMRRPNGEKLSFTYFDTGGHPQLRLRSVQSNFGYQLKIEYQGPDLAISKVTAINDSVEYCSPIAINCDELSNSWPSITYSRSSTYPIPTGSYDTDIPYTETITDPENNVRSFVILQRPTGPYGSILSNVITSKRYGQAGALTTNYTYKVAPFDGNRFIVDKLTDKSGIWSYGMALNGPDFEFISNKVSPNNVSESYISTVSALPTDLPPVMLSTTDGLGRITQYKYDGAGRLTHLIKPLGAMSGGTPVAGFVENQYDGRGNVISVSRIPNHGSPLTTLIYRAGYDESCTYPAKCNKPNWIKDAEGNQVDYIYDTSHGGILSEMQSPPSVGAARPLILTTWMQHYSWIKNSSGALTQSAYPIWRIATKIECQTAVGNSSPVCDAGAPQKVSIFEYGAPGTRFSLLVKGIVVTSGGVTLRTCYNYDIYNRKISETTPSADLGVCP